MLTRTGAVRDGADPRTVYEALTNAMDPGLPAADQDLIRETLGTALCSLTRERDDHDGE